MNEDKTLDEKKLEEVAGGSGDWKVFWFRCPQCQLERAYIRFSHKLICPNCSVQMEYVSKEE